MSKYFHETLKAAGKNGKDAHEPVQLSMRSAELGRIIQYVYTDDYTIVDPEWPIAWGNVGSCDDIQWMANGKPWPSVAGSIATNVYLSRMDWGHITGDGFNADLSRTPHVTATDVERFEFVYGHCVRSPVVARSNTDAVYTFKDWPRCRAWAREEICLHCLTNGGRKRPLATRLTLRVRDYCRLLLPHVETYYLARDKGMMGLAGLCVSKIHQIMVYMERPSEVDHALAVYNIIDRVFEWSGSKHNDLVILFMNWVYVERERLHALEDLQTLWNLDKRIEETYRKIEQSVKG